MKEFKIIVTDDRFGSYEEEKTVFSEIGARLEVHNFESDKELLDAAIDADAFLVNLYPMGADIIGQLPGGCRVLSRYGVGYDNVDVRAATGAGIWVANVPDYSVEDVADHALGLLLCCGRGIIQADRGVRERQWNLQNSICIRRIKGKVLGIIGYGRIGRAFHKKANVLGFSEVLLSDPNLDNNTIPPGNGHPASLEEICRKADYISIHTSLNDRTRRLIGKEQLELMKSCCILINTARGPVIDEKALSEALEQGKIAGAALDVLEIEPPALDNKLLAMKNTVLTSHMAYYSKESIVELKTKAARNILSVLTGGKPIYPVNSLEGE